MSEATAPAEGCAYGVLCQQCGVRIGADFGQPCRDAVLLVEESNMKNLDRIRRQIAPARRRKVAARATTLVAEERSLQELRQAHKLTQKRMAQVLGIGQDSVSRLEQRSDLLISTLRGYVEAFGGRLSLLAEFPDQEPGVLTGIAVLDSDRAAARSDRE